MDTEEEIFSALVARLLTIVETMDRAYDHRHEDYRDAVHDWVTVHRVASVSKSEFLMVVTMIRGVDYCTRLVLAVIEALNETQKRTTLDKHLEV